MGIKVISFFILWIIFVFGGALIFNEFVAKQIAVEYMAITGLLLFWVPEIIYRKVMKK